MGLTIEQEKQLYEKSKALPTFQGTLVHRDEKKAIITSASQDLFISDHNPVLFNTDVGVIGTMNLWCPRTPIAPTQAPYENGLFRLEEEEEHKCQLTLLAQYIVELFCLGLDALMLQEIINVESDLFEFFIAQLIRFSSEENSVLLDLETFKNAYRLTRKDSQSYHTFGSSLLINKNTFQFFSVMGSILEERGQVYHIENTAGTAVYLHNVHGIYKKIDSLVQYIQENHCMPNTIIGGDLNIPLANQKAIDSLIPLVGAFMLPLATRKDADEGFKTVDGLFFSEGLRPRALFKPFSRNNVEVSEVVKDRGLFFSGFQAANSFLKRDVEPNEKELTLGSNNLI